MRQIQTAIAVAFLALVVGCASLYTATVSITKVVDAGLKDYAELWASGAVPASVDAKVDAAVEKYRAACGVARDALVAYKTTGDQAAYVQALSALRTAAQGVFTEILPLFEKATANDLQTKLSKATTL